MNHSTKKYYNLMALLLAASISFLSCEDEKDEPQAQDELIADYHLLSDAKDDTGINDDLTLINSPFQDGGVYCNGLYHVNFAEGSVVQTPVLDTLDRGSFTISADFKVSESKDQPVWVIGSCARWLGFQLNADATVSMLYNNASFKHTTTAYSLNEWHTAKIKYENGTASIYLDDVLAGSQEFTAAICDEDDTVIAITNYSNGVAFNGTIRNLKVYNIPAK